MKFLIITRKQIMLCLSLFMAVVVVVGGSLGVYASANRLLPIYCVETEKKQIAISFDAAWGNDDTEQLIDILNGYDYEYKLFSNESTDCIIIELPRN